MGWASSTHEVKISKRKLRRFIEARALVVFTCEDVLDLEPARDLVRLMRALDRLVRENVLTRTQVGGNQKAYQFADPEFVVPLEDVPLGTKRVRTTLSDRSFSPRKKATLWNNTAVTPTLVNFAFLADWMKANRVKKLSRTNLPVWVHQALGFKAFHNFFRSATSFANKGQVFDLDPETQELQFREDFLTDAAKYGFLGKSPDNPLLNGTAKSSTETAL